MIMAGLSTCFNNPCLAPKISGGPGKVRAWTIFCACIGVLVLFIYVIGPAGLETDTLKPMADFIEANQINANAYYYTEVEEFFSAERHMREYLKLVPGADR